MFLSRLYIKIGDDPDRPRPGRVWLRNLYRVHQRLCMAFPSDVRRKNDPQFLAPYRPEDFPEQRHLADQPAQTVDRIVLQDVHSPRNGKQGFLFRIDPQAGGRVVILVQSALEPGWDYAFRNAEYLLAAFPEVKTFDPSFANGQALRFRLSANPTRKIDTKSGPDGRRRHGKRVPVPADRLYEWLARRAESAGFSIDQDSVAIESSYIYVNKTRNDQGQRLRSARYEGLLEVTDADTFRRAIGRGIGPGKAFGFGLLSVMRVHPSPQEEAA